MGSTTFGIENNTMNPAPGRWVTPWVFDKRSGKFILKQWNRAYFDQLHAFMKLADELGIIVEISLFTSYYADNQWNITPLNPRNNTVLTDTSLTFRKLNTIENGAVMDIQIAYVRKMVSELNPYPNFIFEIQNEPWSDNPEFVETIPVDTTVHAQSWQKTVETARPVSLEWQQRIAEVIVSEEKNLSYKHLIAQNISNFGKRVPAALPGVSVLNFHYAYPEAASWNLGLKKAIALDETGFMPHKDIYYRSEAWKFMLAGGATYNNLDYSFTVGHEDGSYPIADRTPGWGGAGYRKQVRVLKNFLEGFSYVTMRPDNSLLRVVSGKLHGYGVLAEAGKQYAIYLEKGENPEIAISLPSGTYRYEWIDPVSGDIAGAGDISVADNLFNPSLPEFQEDIALKIIKKQ
jgi:hypothetical protein